MYFIIFITFIVILILWLLSDNKNTKLIYAQPVKKPAPKPVPKPPTQPPPKPKPKPKPNPQPQPPNLPGRNNVTTTNLAPTKELLAKALAAYQKNNKSGQPSPKSVYKYLVDNGYLSFKNGKWQSNPNPKNGQPPAGSGQPIKPNVGSNTQKPQGGGTQKPQGSGGFNVKNPKEAFAPNPNPKKRYDSNIGGFSAPTLSQWTKGGLKLSPDGRSISVSVNRNHVDGSGNNDDISRNEIAIKPKNIRDINSVSFNFQGSGYDKNLQDNKTGIFFQFKPTGTDLASGKDEYKASGNSGFRLGIKGGNLAIGYSQYLPDKYGKGTPNVVTDSSGKPISMNVPHKFDIIMDSNGLSGKIMVDGKQVYLNGGKTVADVQMDPVAVKKGIETNIKFGLEVPHRSWDAGGTVKGEYDNISINGL